MAIELKKSEKKSVTAEVMEKTLTQIYWFGFKDEGMQGERSPYGDGHCGTKLRAPYGAFYEKPQTQRTAILNELIRQGLLNNDFSVTPKGEQYCLECGYKWEDISGNTVFRDGCVYRISQYQTTPLEFIDKEDSYLPVAKGRACVKDPTFVLMPKIAARRRPPLEISISCPSCGEQKVLLKHRRKVDEAVKCPKCGYEIWVLSAENEAIYQIESGKYKDKIKYTYSALFKTWRWANSGELVPSYITEKFKGICD